MASIVGHGAAFALLAVIGVRSNTPLGESPLIIAELVGVLEPAAAPAPVTSDETAGPETVEPPLETEHPIEPAPAPEPPAPAEQQAVAPPPAVEEPEQEAEPVPTPLPEPPPVERVVEALEPPAAPPVVDDYPETPAEPVQPIGPTRAVASHEERAVLRKLSSWTGRLEAKDVDTTMSWRDDGQEYTAVLKKLPAADSMGMEQLAVEVTTERNGERLVTELRMNRIAFSNFAQFIDRWDPEVQIHDDLIDGRFHSNTEILVSRDRRVKPVFNGKVTLAASDIRTEGPGFLNRRTMFPAGLETSVRRIVLPPRAATFDRAVVPPERITQLERDSLITFHADGTFEAQPVKEDAPAVSGHLGDEPFYLLGDEEVTLQVRGTVNGKVLVYSPERIVIVDDVRYADDPRAPGAGDYLGLVAERNVEIDEPEVTGPGDLEVHASIYARSRFLVRSYLSRRSGTLMVYGSVAAGSVSATEPRFATRIEFDDRLTTMRAPGFPLSDRYELDSMSGEWRAVGAAN